MISQLFLAGPTASGKSALALALAEHLPVEIISVDSVQVYRGLDVGTAKPSLADREWVPHHLIDICDLDQPFDAAQFLSLARPTAQAAAQRGRTALFCGGSGLYFQAFMEGIGSAPPPSEALRKELEQLSTEDLLAELAAKDPRHFQDVDKKNRRRLIRALEVIRITNRPYSDQRQAWSQRQADSSPPTTEPLLVLARDPDDLRKRITARVHWMFENGLVEETRRALAAGLARNRSAAQAIGYRQVIDLLQGRTTLPQAREQLLLRTWHYARRQMTWFRKQRNTLWIHVAPGTAPEQTASEVLKKLAPTR